MNILLVEDNEDIAEALVASLESEGFGVSLASDGEIGAHKALTGAYDCIILDNGLPKKNGFSVCSEIRAARKSTPILMLSADAETDIKIKLLCAGADDYMTKPFSIAELVARINALMRRSQNQAVPIAEFGDVSIDIAGRSVTRNGTLVRMSIKEFGLLAYLLQHRGVAISRQDILENVWDENADPFTTTVETHVSIVRKKITTDSSGPIIETIKGFGYRIT